MSTTPSSDSPSQSRATSAPPTISEDENYPRTPVLLRGPEMAGLPPLVYLAGAAVLHYVVVPNQAKLPARIDISTQDGW